ncbi:MAG: cytochrome b [Alysiella sp.]|uniref:cytochrome b n=1 Tax=Alysiella sp. TaxID=1872483 RepID=UPI0026DD2F62|nr:cytochrome b [Alysiella sp.]MDO4434223.1 cytochrome b [Alysiella sp.]
MKDNHQYYGIISRLLHWGMAAGFAFMLFSVAAWNYNEEYMSLMNYHKSVGFILLILCAIRLVWAAVNFKNRPYGNLIVKIGHLALYAVMLLVPLVGVLRQYGSARGAMEVFGYTVLDKAPEKIQWMSQMGNLLHGKLGWILFVLAAGHIAMAIVHQIKGEKIINRMAGPRR